MKISVTLQHFAALAAIAALSACAPKVTETGDPCAAADRPIKLSNLLENSVAGNYEACLAQVRSQAATALED